MRQWQCPCGAWVDMSRPKHIHHVEARQPSLADMRAARLAGRDGEALNQISTISEVQWSPDFTRRDKPNE